MKPEAKGNECAKFTEKQKSDSEKTIKFLYQNKNDLWKQLEVINMILEVLLDNITCKNEFENGAYIENQLFLFISNNQSDNFIPQMF